MLEWLLHGLEIILVGLIVGGGIVMAVCVRPFLLRQQSNSDSREFISMIESISIKAWSKYNFYAFLSTFLLLALDGIRYFFGLSFSYWHIILIGMVFFAFIWKFLIDHQLTIRVEKNASAAIGSTEQNANHQQAEFLSKAILVMAIFSIFLH